jgi:YbgC/YbaW family acyl-CoA thioester hydrolase
MPNAFTISRRVQFSETDMAGVMHFSNYFRWMEETEHAFFRSLGLSIVQPHEGGTLSWPRVRVSCEYFGPVHFEDEVEMRMVLTDVGEKSATYEMTFSFEGKRVARGRIKMVCCLMKDGMFSSIPIPSFLRPLLEDSQHESHHPGRKPED